MTIRMTTLSKRNMILVLSVLLSSCAVGPDYQRPPIDLPAHYPVALNEGTTTPSSVAMELDWWTHYRDTTLNSLIDSALKNNTDMAKAMAQIDEADAVLAETGASLFPEIDLEASNIKSRTSTLTAQPLPPGTPIISKSNRVALTTSFELDFWGKLRRTSEAARAQALGSRYAKAVTSLTLAGTITKAYFSLRSLDAQVDVAVQTLTSREESLKVVKSRSRGGLADRKSVV